MTWSNPSAKPLRVPLQTASMPPSLAGLTPLPLPLLAPSLPLLPGHERNHHCHSLQHYSGGWDADDMMQTNTNAATTTSQTATFITNGSTCTVRRPQAVLNRFYSSGMADAFHDAYSCGRMTAHLDWSRAWSLVGSPYPLPLPPPYGSYTAPLGAWLVEPLLITGAASSQVYTGCWPPYGSRSSLVLVLAGEVIRLRGANLDCAHHFPLLLLCTLLG
ncbi:unnamed protein product [Protopolystoma xenopodis]|uniref:Uncharacterized protein n=1 Tax=Protopolystoma xenopodis TaxID=117903 RepID=A0A3S5A612_9PLAT|nr:unnamed protein product [Protopolystoma xenopodis]